MKDNVIWKAYMKGFNDEFDIATGKIKPHLYKNKLLERAYNKGREGCIIGDDVTSHGYKSKEQILKEIKNP